MQANFSKDEQEIKAFRRTIGEARFGRYLNAADGDEANAFALYLWNAKASAAFYVPLQVWEVCLRNQMNRFLCWKFSDGAWPYNEVRAVRQFNGRDRDASMKRGGVRRRPEASSGRRQTPLSRT